MLAKTMADAGWTVGSGVIRGVKYSRFRDGKMEYADIKGRPVTPTDEPAESVGGAVEKPAGLMGEAMTKMETAGPSEVARFLMGSKIDKPTLEHLTDTMAVDDALGEYTTDDIRQWLARLGVETKSKQRAQLVQLVQTAIAPDEPEEEPVEEDQGEADVSITVDTEEDDDGQE